MKVKCERFKIIWNSSAIQVFVGNIREHYRGENIFTSTFWLFLNRGIGEPGSRWIMEQGKQGTGEPGNWGTAESGNRRTGESEIPNYWILIYVLSPISWFLNFPRNWGIGKISKRVSLKGEWGIGESGNRRIWESGNPDYWILIYIFVFSPIPRFPGSSISWLSDSPIEELGNRGKYVKYK